MHDTPYKIICLMGATASGKTDLALKLKDQYPIELISVDSALIYRGMDIGTAKPSQEVLSRYPHHLIDICDPHEKYSAANFCDAVHQLVSTIYKQNKIPLLVGGTMMYFKALFNGLAELPDANPSIRAKLNDLISVKGSAYLHEQLQKIDPIAAKQIHPNDPQRLQRALEVYALTGKPLSHFWQQQSAELKYQPLKIALNPTDRKILHHRIQQRFELMLAQGFLDEVKSLMARNDLSLDLPSMRCVGYRQAWQHLAGDYDYDTMKEKAITATRQLAKRQITWLRSFDDVHWYDSNASNLLPDVCNLIGEFMR